MRAGYRSLLLPLREPFVSNTGVTTEVRQVLLELHWEGLTGYGAARGAGIADFEAVAAVLEDASPYDLQRVLDALSSAGASAPVRSAVDLALHDLLGKASGQPLHRLFGLAGLPIAPTAVSIGACPDDELLDRARALADWPIIKLKLTPADDGRRAGVLRSVYDGRIRADGNGSWSRDQALRVAEELHRHGVELLEQPVAASTGADLDDLAYVHERSPVPIVADEDCRGPEDVLRLRGRVTGVNVKLVKCGGLRAAQEMVTLARRCGLQVMLGCKVESVLGVTAMAQLAPLADHLDLDGHVDLCTDPFVGVELDRGVLTVPDRAGLGATPITTWDTEKPHR